MEKLFTPTAIRGGQPEFQPNENIIIRVDNVTIYDGDKKSQYLAGVVFLTPSRVIWSNLRDIALSLHHQIVLNVEIINNGFIQINSSPKILITLVQRSFRLSFHAGKRDEFFKAYQSALVQFRQQKDQQNKSNINMTSPPSYQQHQQQQQQQQQQNPFVTNQYQQYQPPQNQMQQNNSYSPYGGNQYQSPMPPPQQPQLPSYMLNSINNNSPSANNYPYQQYQPSYLQQQQQQIPQYQQNQSPPNYALHMQQHQSSSPPLHVNINNQFPPSYQASVQQRSSIYGAPTASPTTPNQNLQNFINQPNTSSTNSIRGNDNGFTSNAGIGGILKQMNKKTEENDKLLTEAFSDLNALMEKAKDMVTLSEKLKITLDKKTNSATSTGDTSEEEEFRSFLMQMGIESPVTKKSAKSKYHIELSKQLSEWIINKNILKQSTNSSNSNNGMITLSDLYCIFNRARGIELISPDDLYRACLLFESLDLPLRLRKFDSGVIVVQSKDENDQQVGKEILNIIKDHGPISAFDLSKIQSISLNLAKEQLFNSEKIGILCRDETLQGILFHDNIFII
ncbi:hypothetical protein DICPUDRAFT_42424 [Dictyostelium purpureum]|uniref:Vacuolar protein-sorting-associated protein 36 n=1 Tax=Dictyostelium purpureum TaxID=5786 RepID=F1A216_DICPU|nr:uncharacterized protein DICPUDRAFT_42424 [Dictyostelium purpureum]EGC29761.1 hypothetical protein DICPUDRAFT_42424 [Dictyostelium purpureum]|eukprot:XP_003293707.1 hypothetical protein DICPUDRAFT_42424 [Dictyostelium purpureum]